MKKIVVFGSYIHDYMTRQPGLPLPGQTISGNAFMQGHGGKGSNQAIAAMKAGADVQFITKIGDDEAGRGMLQFYRELGLSTDAVIVDPAQVSGAALIMVDENTAQNQIVVVPGACNSFDEGDLERCRPLLEQADIVLFQHEINQDAQNKAIAMVHEMGKMVVVNPAPARPIQDNILAMVDLVTPNETEAMVLTGVQVVDEASATRAAKVFLDKGVKNVVITMGAMGAFATDGMKQELLPRIQVEAIDTTGAGDAFNGGLVAALSQGKDLFTAIRYGNVVGALSVTKMGAAAALPNKGQITAMYQANYGA